MSRTVFTACLILSTLFGPMACCCSAKAAPVRSLAATPIPVKHRKSCCETPVPADEKPGKPGNRPACPCRQHPSDKQAGLRATVVEADPLAKFRLAEAVPDLLFFHSRQCIRLPLRRVIDPFGEDSVRTGRDILTAHRRLTC